MTDFPDLKIKMLVQFPASVIGGIGLSVTKSNGSYTFDLNTSELAQVSTVSVAGIPTTFLVLWESTQNSYRRITLADFKLLLASMP